MDKILRIPEIPENCHFWMVRTKGGIFFNEFINEKFIAIGWNMLDNEILRFGISKQDERIYKDRIRREYKDARPGLAINKCKRFYGELACGDIAMIVGNNQVAFAIIGEYYEPKSRKYTTHYEIEINELIKNMDSSQRKSIRCPYLKRRKIDIIAIIEDTNRINPYLYKAMVVNRHSLSSLDEYADSILSACYDVYYNNNTFSFTFHIGTQESIAALDLVNFVSITSRILSENESHTISIKTALHSPGDIILQVGEFINNNIGNYLSVLLIYLAIFGGKYKDYEIPSLIKLLKSVFDLPYQRRRKKLEEEKFELENEKLRLDNDKAKIEIQKLEEKLELENENLRLGNDKAKAEIQKVLDDGSFRKLVNLSSKLEISPASQNIVNIQELLEFEKNHPSG